MASVDERIVAMSFENSKFEANIATTMGSLNKLNQTIAEIGRVNGLASIEASANKVTLLGPMSALDKLKAKLGFTNAGTTFSDMEKASDTVTLAAPMSALDRLKAKLGFTNAGTTFSDMEKSSSTVTLAAPMSALDRLKAKLGFTNAGTTFSDMERAADRVTLGGPISALDRLKAKLGFVNAGTTFTDMERDADRVSFSGLTSAIDGIGSHMTTMTTAVGVAIGGLAAQVAQKGAAMVKSLALDPIIGGFQEYGTNLSSIQTILANTQDSGGNLKTVNAALNELNTYSDKTIYNFSEMARNIGTFTAAGVQLKPATQAIKGIANLAALSGSNSQQASTAMYQLSQAIASGKVGLQDWNSVVNAGMGGAVFQRALERTGENMGTIAKGAVKVDKATGHATINGQSFRDSIMATPGKQSWLTSDVLTKTLSQFTGDLSDAQLAAQGFNAEQIKTIQQTAKSAQNAATQVKTLPQVFDVAKETIGSGWAKTFQTIFGDFGESKKLFTGMSNAVNGFINTNANARNKILTEWKKLGGRDELIAGLKSAFHDFGAILAPIHDAFRDLFPKSTGKDLFDLTKNFRELMDKLRPSETTIRNLRNIFDGFFAILHIGWTIVKDVAKVFGELLGAAGKGSGGILAFAGNIGLFLKSVDAALTKGSGFMNLLRALGSVLRIPLELLKGLGSAIKSLFQGGGLKGAAANLTGSLGGMAKVLGPLSGILHGASVAWEGFLKIVDKVKTALSPFLTDIANVVGNFGQILLDGIKNANYDKIFSAVQTVLIGGIFLAIKKAITGGVGINVDFGGGVIKNLSETLHALTGNLVAMQKNIVAHTLLTIASAIGILAGAVALLSTINPKKLSIAMTAVAVGMGELVGVVFLLNKAMGTGAGFARMPFVAGSMILLAGALVVLAGATKIFATLSWSKLIRGLTGVGGSLAAIGLATQLMEGPKLLITAAALLPLAIAINILAVAVKIFGVMKWETLGKGLLGVAGSLVAVGLGMKLMPPTMPLIGLGLIAVSVGITLLAGAVAAFGNMKPAKTVQGILAMAAAILALGLAVDTLPPTLALQGAGLIVVAAGMTALSAAIGILGHMSLGTLFKGIIAMGESLVVLAIGLTAMTDTLPGSLALLAAAGALTILVPTLALLGNLSWGTIIKGLVAIGLALATLAIVGGLAAVPLLALGVAIGVLGVGLLAVGGAMFLFAKGVSLLSDQSVKAMAALLAAAGTFIAIFPTLVINFVKGLVSVLQSIVDLAPKIVTALVSIIGQLLTAIPRIMPQLVTAITSIIAGIVTAIYNNAGPIVGAGFHLLMSLLSGISNNIGQVTDKVANIIGQFLDALAKNAPRLIASGARTLLHFLNGIISQLPSVVATVALMISKFVNNVASHIPQIIAAGGNLMVKFLGSIASQVPRIIFAGTNIILQFLGGIQNAIPRIVGKGLDVARTFVVNVARGLARLVDVGFQAIINFLNGLADAIRKNSRPIFNAGFNVAWAIMQGLYNGLTSLAGRVIDLMWGIAKHMLSKFLHVFDVFSPSRVMMDVGKNIMLGTAIGITNSAHHASNAMESAANQVLDTAKDAFTKIPDALDGIMDTQPVITPVLDLSNVKKEASKLSDVIQAPALTAATSSDQAAVISGQAAALAVATDAQVAPAATFSFEQNNYSPDPLSNIELYRQTNNQLSRLKSLVGVT